MRGQTIFFATALMATPAFADGVLPFDGVFGNPSGCHLYATGEKLNDGYLLLTPDTFASARIGCDFNALVSADNVGFAVDAVCSPGGQRRLIISDLGSDGYSIRLDEITFAGPIPRCPEAFLPGDSGVAL